jgi:hypothetical protein
MAGTDAIPDLVLSHLLRRARGREGRFGVRECHQLERPSKALPTVGACQMRSRVSQNTTSAKMLNPLAWTPARTPCILYAGPRIPRQFQLKDGWTCAGDT